MLKTNVVEHNEFAEAQLKALNIAKEALINSFGPMGSNTMIIKEGAFNKYTKDGYTILQNIQCLNIIESFAIKDIVEVTRNIVTTVGDGTTSAVILSALIFESILKNEELKKYAPVLVAKKLQEVANTMTKIIRSHKNETTPEDIYNIALISTNGDEDVANRLKVIYEKFGNGVFIDVAASTTKETLLKEYDGMTLETGFPNPCFINNSKGTSYLRNPKIYAFQDPIDTYEMQSMLIKIMEDNIFGPIKANKACVPTVIMTPKIGSDVNAILEQLMTNMSQAEPMNRPPLLIISNILDADRYEDIMYMTGSRWIRKYLDPTMQEKDIAAGLAPTIENISTWAAGTADVVEADTVATKFINPKNYFETNENDERVYSKKFNQYVAYLEQALEEKQRDQANNNIVGNLKRRINSLKSNMVEYLVGGISPTDRDAERDLVEDAVLNCRSAAKNGWGRAANVEGFLAAKDVMNFAINSKETSTLDKVMSKIIFNAYYDLIGILLDTVKMDEDAKTHVLDVISTEQAAYNLKTESFDNKVVSSIESDVVVIQSIAKIVGIMVTANQCIVPNPVLNQYSKK